MDVVVRARGVSVPEPVRRNAEHRLDKIVRLEPRASRAELDIMTARGSMPDGIKHVEVTLRVPRKTFRARAEGSEVEAAVDQVLARLERQVRDHRDKRRTRVHGRADRLQSAPVTPHRPRAE